ncbi:MAG TPA: hypothetical protein VGB46_03130 [Flavisolibacter sp.]|jgi:hypothetical protein
MPQFALLKEMETALAASNRCSEQLEKLLQEARTLGGHPPPELIERIKVANKECDEAMEHYVSAFNAYYQVKERS